MPVSCNCEQEIKVVVIIPVYNTGTLLRETVNSVLAQSYSDFELILVDDGSNAETQQILSSFEEFYYE